MATPVAAGHEPVTVTIVDDHPAVVAGIVAWYAAAEPPIRVLASGDTTEVAWTPPGPGARVTVLAARNHGPHRRPRSR